MTEEPQQRLSANQRYHLMLADIAMAAAIKTFDPKYAIVGGEGFAPERARQTLLKARRAVPKYRCRRHMYDAQLFRQCRSFAMRSSE